MSSVLAEPILPTNQGTADRKSNPPVSKIKTRSYKSSEQKLMQSEDKLNVPPNLLSLKANKNFVVRNMVVTQIRKIDNMNDTKQKQLLSLRQIDNYYDPNIKYYYLGKGNNPELVKRILDRRKIWVQNNELPFVHFKWTQSSAGVKFYNMNKSMLCFNHFQFHKQITNKQYLVKNLINFCEANKLNAFDFTPTTFIIDLNDENLTLNMNAFVKFFNHNLPTRKHNSNSLQVKQTLQLPRLRLHHSKNEKRCQGNFYCRPNINPTYFSSSTNYLWLLKPTFLNRGRGIHLFTDLAQLQRLIIEYSEGHEQKIPTIAKKQQEKQIEKEKEQELKEIKDLKDSIKQSTNTNLAQTEQKLEEKSINPTLSQTTTIKIKESIENSTNNLGDSKAESKQQDKNSIEIKNSPEIQKNIPEEKKNINTYKIKSCSFVVQKYIQRPLLINGRKFDIRVWALITQNLEVYFFKEGYIRTSCQEYNPKDLNNMYIHLTNNAIQKYSDKYEKYEFGNQLSFDQFDAILQSQGYYKFHEKILKKIKECIWISMCAVKRKINQHQRKFCFEIFGYDFLIDERMKTWLIEVNTNPCIEQSSPLLGQLIPRMLDDAFKLSLDKIFPPPEELIGPHVDKYEDNENMFELLGDFEQANKNTLKKRFTFVRR